MPTKHIPLLLGVLNLAILTAFLLWFQRDKDPSDGESSASDETAMWGQAGSRWGGTPAPAPVVDTRTAIEIPDGALSDEDFAKLAEEDPLAAAVFLSQSPESDEREDRMGVLMGSWVAKNPTQAAGWVEAIPAGEFRDDAQFELGVRWGTKDPESGAPWFAAQIENGIPAGAPGFVASWVGKNPKAASKWVNELEASPKIVGELTSGMVYRWATHDPLVAATYVQTIEETTRRRKALINLTTAWSADDPQAAAAWLGNLPPREVQNVQGAFLAVVQNWADENPAGAVTWAQSIGEEWTRSQVLRAFAQSHAEAEPAQAVAVAEQIEIRDERNEALVNIYETWMDEQPGSGKAALISAIPTLNDGQLKDEMYAILFKADPSFRREVIEKYEAEPATPTDGSAVLPEASPPIDPVPVGQ